MLAITENPTFRLRDSRAEIKLHVKPTIKDRHRRDGGFGQGYVLYHLKVVLLGLVEVLVELHMLFCHERGNR